MNDWTRGRARIGVGPFSNTNLEPDLMMLCPPGVSLHFARVGGNDLDAIPDERRMRHYCGYAGLGILSGPTSMAAWADVRSIRGPLAVR